MGAKESKQNDEKILRPKRFLKKQLPKFGYNKVVRWFDNGDN